MTDPLTTSPTMRRIRAAQDDPTRQLDERRVDDVRPDEVSLDLEERQALRRVPGLATELEDVTEVEYRQLRLERVVLVGVWTSGTQADADRHRP